MKVKLVSRTQGYGEMMGMKLGEMIAYAARVSNPSNQMNTETAPKLLSYCLRHGHWSVFETVSMTLEIVTSRAIAQQILRHRSFTFQEFSQRYAEVLEFETYPARRQDHKNRQNSIDDLSAETMDWFEKAQATIQAHAMGLYQQALQLGIAKEQARFLLPSSARSTIYMSGNIRSWIHYCEQRCKPGVQLEHREIAMEVLGILLDQVPELKEYFERTTAL